MRPLLRHLEALLFASGRPLTREELGRALGVPVFELAALLDEYRGWSADRGFRLSETEAGIALVVTPEFAQAVVDELDLGRDPLTPAALEVLAIVAWKEPIDRAGIEALRGVRSDRSLALLQEEGLIEPAGRGEGPGRPVLWRTTPEFLLRFGLESRRQVVELFAREDA